MAISKYKFVSPGVQAQEIDNSNLSKTPDEIGPVVIGRSQRGPIMRPVKVNSYQEFAEIFGEPHPGGESNDVWRSGNKTSPLYGAYAAQAYLKNSNALTFVRLGGLQNSGVSDSVVGKAGWKTTYGSGSTVATNGGAYGLFVATAVESTPNSSSVQSTTGTLAAIIYVDHGTVGLTGNPLIGSTESTNQSGVWIKSSGTNYQFKIAINDGTTTTTKTVNFDPNSQNYIRKQLNTNPTLVNEDRVASTTNYWLGETFKTQLDKTVNNTANSVAGFIVKLGSGSLDQANYLQGAAEGTTPWIVSQHLGAYTSYVADANGEYPVTKLFKVHGLSEGEWLQKNLKVAIEDLQLPNDQFNQYGTFTLSLRKINDTDANPQYVERFSGLTLDPNSDNFIAKVIGDKYSTWDYTEKRFYEYGSYENRSKYIRIELNPDLEQGAVAPQLIPFGFYGPRRFNSFTLNGTGSVSVPAGAFIDADYKSVASVDNISGNAGVLAQLIFPTVPMLNSSSTSTATSLRNVSWGFKTNKDSSKLYNEDVVDVLGAMPAGFTENSGNSYGFFFSLDDIVLSGSNLGPPPFAATTGTIATWQQDARYSGLSVTSNSNTVLNGASGFLSTFNKFVVPFVGGFDGLDITEKDPFNKTVLEGSAASNRPQINGATVTTNYAYNSIRVALDSISDPEMVEMNLVAMPGIENEGLTGQLVDLCEKRGDSMAIIDLKGDFVPTEANTSAASARKPVVSTVIDNLNARGINSSYGSAYFPWVQVKDSVNNKNLFVPPSVIALGVMSKSQKNTELWFAPAGFNRGGLTDGASGLAVNAVTLKLTSRDRDNLYAANINPIASFPSEGIVVFGQKTLQVTPSALDRINVRRLMIYLKKEISRMASTVLFDPNVDVTWKRFTNQADPLLSSVQSKFGLSEYKLLLDKTTTTPELVDRNIVYAKIFLKPARSTEFIALDFYISSSGANFSD